MKNFTIETHWMGASVGKPQKTYHLVNGANNIHEFVTKSLDRMHSFCRYSELGVMQGELHLILSKEDRERWNKLNKNK